MKRAKVTVLAGILMVGAPLMFPSAAQAQCQASGPGVTVHINRNQLKVTPDCKRIYSDTFLIEIHNPPGSGYNLELGSVTVEEKQLPGGTLPDYTVTGSNDVDPTYLVVNVAPRNPADQMPTGAIDFDVRVAGHGSLDPRVEISDTSPTAREARDLLERFALSLGLALEALMDRAQQAE